MANTKSAQKNIRKAHARMLHNRAIKSKVRTLGKKVKEATASNDVEGLKKAIAAYSSALDKAAKRDIVHRNKANRQKAVCAKLRVSQNS